MEMKDIKTIRAMAKRNAEKHYKAMCKCLNTKYERKIYLKSFNDMMLILEREMKLPEGVKNV